MEILTLPLDQADLDIDYERRFGGVARLYGAAALRHFAQAHVCVIGVGGVGSWAAEALARTAIGTLTLIDFDNLAESNVNRQIHALSETLGQAKVGALEARIAQINPYCQVHAVEDFVTAENLEVLIGAPAYDYVIDAMDDARAKVALLAFCRVRGIRVLTVGSAGGKMDPTRIEVRDLARTEQEPLLAKVRRRLRTEEGFPRGPKHKFGMEAVFSTEPVRQPEPADSCALGEAAQGITGLNCAGYGSAVAVTATFGLVAAGQVLRQLAQAATAPSNPEPAAATSSPLSVPSPLESVA